MIIAIKKNNIEIVKALLENENIDINKKSLISKLDKTIERTPLHYAVENNNIEIVQLLLKLKEIDVNAKDEEGKTPKEYAKNAEIIQLFDH